VDHHIEDTVPFAQFRVVQISGWKLALGAALLLTLFLALFILAAGVLLLALPVAAIAGALTYLVGKRNKPASAPEDVIEVEYREVEQKQLEQDAKPQDPRPQDSKP
jgi:hypothetical protein